MSNPSNRSHKTDREIEAEVEKRHARIAQERAAELERNPTRDLASLTSQMDAMRKHIDSIPENHEFSMQAIDDLDDCRVKCEHLKLTIEAILEGIQGT